MKLALVALAALAAAAPAAKAPPGPVQTRTRADAVGDVYRYRSETRYAEKTRDDMVAQVNTQVFELEVLGVSAEGLRLRYTLREASVTDTSGPAMSAPLKATVGIPLEFRVDRAGMLTGLDNWPAFRQRLLANIDGALPAGDEVRNIVHQRMDQNPTDEAQDMVLSDVALLRGVELRGPVTPGKVASLDTRRRPPANVMTETTVKTPGCVLHINRVTTGATAAASQTTTADADVSVKDGRVIALTQNRTERAGASVVDERLKITRLSAAPGC
jgi:hypothetical protein